MSFAERLEADRRFAILQLLAEAPAHSANDSILKYGLVMTGRRCSRDLVQGDLAWLKEHGLVTIKTLPAAIGFMLIATLTKRGANMSRDALPANHLSH